MIEATADDTPDGHDRDAGTSVLLVRRHRYTRTVSYYRCFTPGPVTLTPLVSLVCHRRRVEDDFQDAKEICHFDKGQVTCWNSWHFWSVIALVAYASWPSPPALERAARTGRNDPAEADLVPLSSHELLRLLRALVLPPPQRDHDHLLWWSTWRRRHINTAPTSAAVGAPTPTPHQDQTAHQQPSTAPVNELELLMEGQGVVWQGTSV
ncbi:hypothetical protein KV205_35055 [Streptomyces sp. SKN60]|uniref:hypothetical protein n=1 Tax=Streptomyces sp. SKN60 TaxID=2855506 RepID=UPI00224812BC|nr:hypothetical protein [Streptomyces sp. SKN60]MCX2185689.1 hypothetical protein [Streptomyces sp. SKN60]